MIRRQPIVIFVLGCFLLVGMGSCQTRDYSRFLTQEDWPCAYEIPYAENGVTIDGILDEWEPDESIYFVDDIPPPERNSARAWAMWDEQYLYVAFSVRDSYLRGTHTGHDNAFPDDCVEFLIDTRSDRSERWMPDDYCWHVNLRDAILDDRGTRAGEIDTSWNGNAVSKTVIHGTLNDDIPDEGYDVEIAVPWTDLGLRTIEEDRTFGMDFCVNDFDADMDEYLYFDWCNLQVFHKPSGFGQVRLVKQVEIPAKKPRSERLIW